uniref:Uncharacterized protein n=1 Tax=Ditylenchus dipsaci TaxID=166011 RepID=A0A915EH47_9BILA
MIGALSSEKKLSSEKRHSVNPKVSSVSATCEPHTAPPASAIAASPNAAKILDVGKRQNVFSPFGQLFLCIIGTLLSISVSVWLAFFSTDLRWRRAVFATAAAICSVMFMLLAFATYRRNSRHRRSTAGGSARRSTKTEEECILPPSRNGGSQDHINRPPIIMQHTTTY